MKQLVSPGTRTQGTDEKNQPKQKDAIYVASLYLLLGFGEPGVSFFEHLSTDKLIEDLIKLYVRMIDLGFEYRSGRVYLPNLEGV